MSTGSIKHNIEITDSADAERFVEALEKAKAESEEGMERLTYRTHPSKDVYLAYGLDEIWRKKLKKLRYDIITNAVDRLAAYEDTGLTPERIRELQNAFNILFESERQKQQENEQLRAQVEMMRETLEKAREALQTIKEVVSSDKNRMYWTANVASKALAEIDKVMGGKEDE